MAAVSNIAKHRMATQDFTWTGITVGVLLLDDSQATDPDRDFVAALTGEIAGTNYERKTLTGKSTTRDDANNRTVLDGDSVVWEGIAAGTPDRMVLFQDTGDDATSVIISYHLLRDAEGGTIFTNGGDMPYHPHEELGYLTITGG